jgi:cytochrome b561
MTRTGYSTLQIGLHWLIALMIPAAWWLSDGMGPALGERIKNGDTGFTGNTLHVWLGGAVFAIVLIRIVVRLISGAPDHVPGSPAWQDMLATWGHRLLYLLMVGVPALGALAWYGQIRISGDIHGLAANALMIVALGHAAAGLYHHYIVKDDTLRRMLRPQ